MDMKPSDGVGQASFKDYCLVLQIHPDADAEVIDAAYWHLARRYSERLGFDPDAKLMLDELNEAYSIMRSSERREEYSRLRESVLGVGALPFAPEPEDEPHMLPVLGKAAGRIQGRRPASIEAPQPGLPRITAR